MSRVEQDEFTWVVYHKLLDHSTNKKCFTILIIYVSYPVYKIRKYTVKELYVKPKLFSPFVTYMNMNLFLNDCIKEKAAKKFWDFIDSNPITMHTITIKKSPM